jgi:hypothetical protein
MCFGIYTQKSREWRKSETTSKVHLTFALLKSVS